MSDEMNINLINAGLVITNFREGDIIILKIDYELSEDAFNNLSKHLKEKFCEGL